MENKMNIAVIGGNGYIGKALITRLIAETNHSVVSISPHAKNAVYETNRVSAKNANIFDVQAMHEALAECDVAYYLVHMMGQTERDFVEAETEAANKLVEAIQNTSVKKVIFLGGLGNDSENLSKHLASRHETGRLLQKADAQVIEFRASMVIGKGSASYDIITNLVHKLPILFLPIWAKTLTQPIGLDDAIRYLISALSLPETKNVIVEIGCPEAMTYENLMIRYARWKGSKTWSIHIPFVPVFVAAWWLNSFTPGNHAKVGKVMVESLANPMIVTNDVAKQLFPDVETRVIEDCFV